MADAPDVRIGDKIQLNVKSIVTMQTKRGGTSLTVEVVDIQVDEIGTKTLKVENIQ